MEVFCDTWAAHINDLSRLAKELDATASGKIAAEKQAYMSLPRPGVSSSSDTSSLSDRVQMLSVVDVSAGVNDSRPSKSASNSPMNPEDTSSSSSCNNTSPESSKAHQTASSSGYVSAEPGPSYATPNVSAFVPYRRQPNEATILLNREQPNAPVIMRQAEAPLAKFDDDLLVEKKTSQFENRISLILDDLNVEAQSLSQLQNAHRSQLPQFSRNGANS